MQNGKEATVINYVFVKNDREQFMCENIDFTSVRHTTNYYALVALMWKIKM